MYVKGGYSTIFVVLFPVAIAGFLARCILYCLKEGDHVEVGDLFGITKFSSHMGILVPSNVHLQLKDGNKRVAGETIIGKIL